MGDRQVEKGQEASSAFRGGCSLAQYFGTANVRRMCKDLVSVCSFSCTPQDNNCSCQCLEEFVNNFYFLPCCYLEIPSVINSNSSN